MNNKENVRKLLDVVDTMMAIHDEEYGKAGPSAPSEEAQRFLVIWSDLARFTSEQVRRLF